VIFFDCCIQDDKIIIAGDDEHLPLQERREFRRRERVYKLFTGTAPIPILTICSFYLY
jgi:hypothetical protein